jgi:hypothetical protein
MAKAFNGRHLKKDRVRSHHPAGDSASGACAPSTLCKGETIRQATGTARSVWCTATSPSPSGSCLVRGIAHRRSRPHSGCARAAAFARLSHGRYLMVSHGFFNILWHNLTWVNSEIIFKKRV